MLHILPTQSWLEPSPFCVCHRSMAVTLNLANENMDLRIYRGDGVSSASVTPRSGNLSAAVRIREEINTLGQFIPLHYHFVMLQDEHRVNAFRSAIELVVRPGMHVLELGGGTGILSSFAARQGANVICVEQNPELVDCAERLLKLNQLEGSVTVINANASEYVPSQPVDVVICEMLHVGLLREKQLQVIHAIDPNTKSSIDWPNQFLILPLHSPIEVRADEECGIQFSYRAGESIDSLAGSIQVSVKTSSKMKMAA